MASNDRHYANHYATIKKWLDEDSKGRRGESIEDIWPDYPSKDDFFFNEEEY